MRRLIKREKHRSTRERWLRETMAEGGYGEQTRFEAVPRATLPAGSETRQLAVLRSGSAVFHVIYSREMARFLVYILEREPHYFVHPVICPLVVCPGRRSRMGSSAFSQPSWRAVTRRHLAPSKPFISLLVDKLVFTNWSCTLVQADWVVQVKSTCCCRLYRSHSPPRLVCLRLDVEIADDLFGHREGSDRIVALFDSLSILDGQREITENSGDLECKVAESNWLTLSRLTREYVTQITGHG